MREHKEIVLYKPKSFRHYMFTAPEWHGPRWLEKWFRKWKWVYDRQIFSDVIRLTVVPTTKKFLSTLFDECMDIEKVYDYRPKNLIIGTETWQELCDNDDELREYFFSYKLDYGRNQFEIFGLEVKVVPWIKGWALY